MPEKRIGIPLHGKMAARAFHAATFRECLAAGGLAPIYFLSPRYYRNFPLDPRRYFELQTTRYDDYYRSHALLRNLKTFRRFAVRTETTDLRFRESVENMLYDTPIWKLAWYLLGTDVLRQIPRIGDAALWLETNCFPQHTHEAQLKEQDLDCVLTPGMGNYNFWYEGNFALEAQRLGLPAFAAITNYDNIVNMGFRGYTPRCLAVWSRQMADEAMKLQALPVAKIEITGPVQYDRFMQPLNVGREPFLRSINLDPNRKTILFAGGVNITRYFEMYRLLVEDWKRVWPEPFNLIVRPYPHVKVLGSPGWHLLEGLLPRECVYLSDPGSIDASGDRKEEFRRDLSFEDGPDELSYLLRYSDVMINTFSTISLEAAICDLPVIHLGYDTHTFGQRYGTIAAFQQRQTHNRRKLRLAASKVAKSESELVVFVMQYLNDRTLDREERREYAVSECGELDGKAGVRLVEMIMSRL
jgi:hypothetical protein